MAIHVSYPFTIHSMITVHPTIPPEVVQTLQLDEGIVIGDTVDNTHAQSAEALVKSLVYMHYSTLQFPQGGNADTVTLLNRLFCAVETNTVTMDLRFTRTDQRFNGSASTNALMALTNTLAALTNALETPLTTPMPIGGSASKDKISEDVIQTAKNCATLIRNTYSTLQFPQGGNADTVTLLNWLFRAVETNAVAMDLRFNGIDQRFNGSASTNALTASTNALAASTNALETLLTTPMPNRWKHCFVDLFAQGKDKISEDVIQTAKNRATLIQNTYSTLQFPQGGNADTVTLLNWLFHAVETNAVAMDLQFNRIDQRFNGIDQRFDGIDQRFDGIDHHLDRTNLHLNYIYLFY
ncbi:hypothetical protein JB92DRAFT_2831805 [Gautieria morchelliformis]|nr:hypothetical protein JB92DRAFT_2831805 [Gautieria morchelliformis]